MDFQSISNRHDPIQPVTFTSKINQTSSSSSSLSSTVTLTSIRSSANSEFNDNTKPSGVLVDDDFLLMSSPIDEHFWNMTTKDYHKSNHNECFPAVGSSPDTEVKYFDFKQLNTLAETSCDEDDDSISSLDQSEMLPVKEYSIDKSKKSLVVNESILIKQKISRKEMQDKTSSIPSKNQTEWFDINSSSFPLCMY